MNIIRNGCRDLYSVQGIRNVHPFYMFTPGCFPPIFFLMIPVRKFHTLGFFTPNIIHTPDFSHLFHVHPRIVPTPVFSLQTGGSFTPRISHPRIFHPLQVHPLPDCSHPIFFVITCRKVHPLGII